MKVCYIAGAYSAPHAYQVKLNIQAAERLGMEVAKLGAVPLCPHTNTSHWEGIQSDEWFYEATLSLLKKCDACVVVPGSENTSTGTRAEIKYCEQNDIPWFAGNEIGLKQLAFWLKKMQLD